jgi:hypothetical protein
MNGFGLFYAPANSAVASLWRCSVMASVEKLLFCEQELAGGADEPSGILRSRARERKASDRQA